MKLTYTKEEGRERGGRRKKHSANSRKASQKQPPYNASISGKGAKTEFFFLSRLAKLLEEDAKV